jgi:hypothetical protein
MTKEDAMSMFSSLLDSYPSLIDEFSRLRKELSDLIEGYFPGEPETPETLNSILFYQLFCHISNAEAEDNWFDDWCESLEPDGQMIDGRIF